MTITTIEGKSLCEALADNYKRTLPKAQRSGTAWTMESFSTWVSLRYPEVRVVEGQEWKGIGTTVGGKSVKHKYKFICKEHGEYLALADNVLTQKVGNNGSQCKGCRDVQNKQRKDAITAAFVGQTTSDGHLILEHIGYKATPSDVAKGKIGQAQYRYRCAVCGNEQAKAWGTALKTPGQTTHCGCLSIRDSRNTFSRSEAKANAPCFIYIFSTIANTGIKLGITNSIKHRATKNYDTQLFVSQTLPRATCWAVEQVLLHRLRALGLQYDLENVPAFMNDGQYDHVKGGKKEAGASEVFYGMPLDWVISQIIDLISEADAIGWQALLDRYIPITEMDDYQLFYWDGKGRHQSKGEGYIGHKVKSVFELGVA